MCMVSDTVYYIYICVCVYIIIKTEKYKNLIFNNMTVMNKQYAR